MEVGQQKLVALKRKALQMHDLKDFFRIKPSGEKSSGVIRLTCLALVKEAIRFQLGQAQQNLSEIFGGLPVITFPYFFLFRSHAPFPSQNKREMHGGVLG